MRSWKQLLIHATNLSKPAKCELTWNDMSLVSSDTSVCDCELTWNDMSLVSSDTSVCDCEFDME